MSGWIFCSLGLGGVVKGLVSWFWSGGVWGGVLVGLGVDCGLVG